jgi:hypothetical protein
VDNFFTAKRPNVAGLMSSTRFEFVRHDVCFPLCIEVDKIYNLACGHLPLTTNSIRSDQITEDCGKRRQYVEFLRPTRDVLLMGFVPRDLELGSIVKRAIGAFVP